MGRRAQAWGGQRSATKRRARLFGQVACALATFVAITSVAGSVATAKKKTPPSGLQLYVGNDGSDAANPCTSVHLPCATIAHALTIEAESNDGGTIHVLKGTYTGQISVGQQNTGVTIEGASPKRTIIEAPSTGLVSTSDPNSPGNPLYYVVQFTPGVSNVTLENLTVSGGNGIGSIPSAACGADQDYAGVYFDDASGSVNDVDVTGIDLPADQFSCPGVGRGVYVASSSGGSSAVNMNTVSLPTATCSFTTTVPLAPGTYSSQNLPVTRVKRKGACKKWTEGPVLVGGVALTAHIFGSHTVQVSGTVPYYVQAGSTVNIANPYLPAYDGAGILCENAGTWCAIGNSSIQGEGPTNLVSQTGLEVDGASAALTSDTVSGNTDTCGALGSCAAGDNPGSGVKIVDGGTVTAGNNHLTDNDVNLLGQWDNSGILPDSAGRTLAAVTTVASTTTLTSSVPTFLPSDVGRSVTQTCPPCSFNTYSDGVAMNASQTFTSGTADFTSADVGQPIVDNGGGVIPAHTTILAVASSSSVTLSTDPVCASTCTGVAFYLPSRQGLEADTVIASWVSSNVVLLSEPALASARGSITLGPLPGVWDLADNTASDATAAGGSAGITGFGNGIELDSTDPDACTSTPPDHNAAVIVQGNTADNNTATGIELSSASCAVVGGSLAGEGNTATGNHIGLDLDFTGSTAPASVDDVVTGNKFTGNGFGVVAGGDTALQQYGGPPATGLGSTGNVMNDNTWTGNSLANVVDFAQWGHVPCSSSCTLTLSTPLAAGVSANAIVVTSVPASLPTGTVLQISEAGSPTMNILVTAPVSASAGVTDINTTSFTPGGSGFDSSAVVSVEPYAVTAGTNTWGSTTADSCDPTVNGSAPFDSLTFGAGFASC
jgi:hypothetical protein